MLLNASYPMNILQGYLVNALQQASYILMNALVCGQNLELKKFALASQTVLLVLICYTGRYVQLVV